MEEFRDIPGYEGRYKICSDGLVLSIIHKPKILKPTKSKKGYLYVDLCKDSSRKKYFVHQLVAMAFLDHSVCGMKKVIDHIDFDRTNNHVSNLKVVTARENCSRSQRKKTSIYVGVHFVRRLSKWSSEIRIGNTKKYLGLFNCETQAHIAYQEQLKLVNS
jgi:hypothetical protein